MSDQELAAIRARVEAASPGPWGDYDDSDELVAAPNHLGLMEAWVCRCTYGAWISKEQKAANQQFIAHARTDVPALLAEVERLRAALEEITESFCMEMCGEGVQHPACKRARAALSQDTVNADSNNQGR